jgi:hypothetical protein
MSAAKRALVLSVDYEVFGNGSGSARAHITAPTERMARICEKFGAPLTIYFEVEEYLAFVRERAQLTTALGYDPAQEIHTQLVELARRGHDLQLHLHPEWVGAKFVGNRWQLRPEKRTVDSLFETAEEVSRFIAERKAVIDDILREAGRAHAVTAYRAGAFCAQPGGKLLRALADNGFVLDSSLVKGMHREDEHVTFDFTSAPAGRRHWNVRDDVAREQTDGPIVEVPIYSQMGRRYHQLTPKRLLAKFSKNVPKDKQREMVGQLKVGRNPVSLAKFLLQRFPTKLDFHNMSAAQMLRWVRTAPVPPSGDLDVVVLIGHTKEHRDDADFERFVAEVTQDPALEIISLHELSRRLVAQRATARSAVSAA